MRQSMGGLTTHSTGARVSLPLMLDLAVSALCARPVNSSVMPLRSNRSSGVDASCRSKAEYRLNDFNDGRPNNSFNASGNSLDVIRKVGGFSQFFPPR